MTEYLDVPGGRIGYDVTGSGPLVVLAPGMGDVRATFRFLAPELTRAGFRVAATDLRGHGDSSAGWASYTNADAGSDLAALIRHLGAPAIVVAHSFSGGSAIWLAAEDSTLFSELVLIGAFTRPVSMNPLMRQVARVVLSVPTIWTAYYKSLHKGPRPPDFPDYLKGIRANMREPGRMAAARAMGLGAKSDLDGRLARITTPALIVYGSADPDFPDPRAEADTIAGELAGPAQIAMIEGAGHYPHVEEPHRVAAAILAFLRERADA